MSPTTIGLLIFAVTIAVLATGMPIAFALGAVALLFMVAFDGWNSVNYLPETIFAGLSDFTLVSLPMFIIMGAAVASSRAGSDLYEALSRWLHRVPGSLVISNIGACALFSALTGSSPATCAAIGKMGIPEMRKRGYDADLATGAIAAGGTLGILIPPSVPMVIYGILTETDIGKLFAAGVLPGIVMMLMYMAAVWLTAIAAPHKTGTISRSDWGERLASLRGVLPVLGLFALVFGGLYAGVFTPSESAGIGAGGGLLFLFIRRRADWATIREALRESVELTAVLLPVTIGAAIFTNFLTIAGLTQSAAAWVQSFDIAPVGVVLVMCLIYVLLGCVFDGLAMIFLTIPIFFPIVQALALDPIWFGIVVVIVVELGLITPPLGMNVFVVKGLIPDVGSWQMFANVGGFVVAALACLGVVIAWPGIALWLPSFMR